MKRQATKEAKPPKKLDESWKEEPIPTPKEVDAWIAELEFGYGKMNFLPRLVLAYRKLYYDKIGKRRKRR